MVYAGEARSFIKVAILESNDAVLKDVHELAVQNPHFVVVALSNAAAYFETYSAINHPDVLLVGLDANPQMALSAAKRIISLAPACGLVVYGRAATMELLSQAMSAGARRYVPYPFDAGALHSAVNEVFDQVKPLLDQGLPPEAPLRETVRTPKVISVFSPKGGVGTSTLAVNLACALSTMRRRVAILDGNISFGNIGVFLNVAPSRSMLQLIEDAHGIQESGVEEVLLPHPSGVKVLLAPVKPEEADSITGDHLRTIIGILRSRFDYVVVDTWPVYDERVLAMLDSSDTILAPSGPELPSIKNLAMFLRVADLLNYPKEKVIPVLMRANSVPQEYLQDIEVFLKQPLDWRVVSDGRRVTQAINHGEPFVLSEPEAPVSKNIMALAQMVDGRQTQPLIAPPVEQHIAQPFWKRFRVSRAQ